MTRWYPKGLLALALPLILGVGPCSRMPGGVLNGPVVGAPVGDWSSLKERLGLCSIESRAVLPHSVTVACWNQGTDLYVGCMSCEGKMWSTYVNSNPQARIKIGDAVYAVSMNRITDSERMRGPWQARWEMFGREGEVPEIPETYWLWRLTSR